MDITFYHLAHELQQLLEEDQSEKKALAQKVFQNKSADYSKEQKWLIEITSVRSKRLLEILDEIGEPSLSNIGDDGALAMSVLASHDPKILKTVLDAFNKVYDKDPADCRYQSIPAMTDAYLISIRKPQTFGTQWFFDANNYPFLYWVHDFETVNERRAQYGIEPLRWPKSLAIDESKQPWLARPLSELVTREPTEDEYRLNLG